MNNLFSRYYFKKLKHYLAIKTEMVNHQEIIREVASGVEHSWIYYLMLLMAALIALLGLLTNSVAVVIGAMLISPLMGPIISSGLALTIGDLSLARRAFRTIAISVMLTILLAAFVTLLSPLKEPTSEILARVRPNIYDLFIAMLSGIVGAVALCTKRNYLITATGVAVATAVIPPLSVAGYGLGTGQIMLGLGGFLLFFTNFVAIVLTSDIVFFIMGFRTSHHETIQYSQRTRLVIIAVLLSFISVPLIYTLVVDIRKVKTKQRVERVLKKHLNKENFSRMSGYSFKQLKEKTDVRATVNTVNYIAKPAEQTMQSELKASLGNPVDLHLEQVLVASGRLPDQPKPSDTTAQEEDTAVELATKTGRLVTLTEQELATATAPFPLGSTRLAFGKANEPLLVTSNLKRDYPVNDDENVVLERLLERSLKIPVRLQITCVPLFSPFGFTGDGQLTPESKSTLSILKQLPNGSEGFRFVIGTSGKRTGSTSIALKQYLMKELGVSDGAITFEHRTTNRKLPNVVTLRVIRPKGAL